MITYLHLHPHRARIDLLSPHCTSESSLLASCLPSLENTRPNSYPRCSQMTGRVAALLLPGPLLKRGTPPVLFFLIYHVLHAPFTVTQPPQRILKISNAHRDWQPVLTYCGLRVSLTHVFERG